MESDKDIRRYAAYLARQFYSGKKPIRLIEDEFPFNNSDKELNQLLNLIKRTPKRKGLFKVRASKYEAYVQDVYELIEKLEK